MFPSRFRYEAPHSLDEAIGLLRDGGDDVKVLAGGQSLVPMMKLRFASPELLVDINNVPDLAYHRADADGSLWGAGPVRVPGTALRGPLVRVRMGCDASRDWVIFSMRSAMILRASGFAWNSASRKISSAAAALLR